jgi:LysW-gamma-L-lysine carboxypeptidase
VVYGPGDSALDHTPAEHISLEEYARSVKVLCHALRSLATPA